MAEFAIWVKTETKRRLIRQAAQNNRSLCAEIALQLLEGYRPEGWEKIYAEVQRRTRLRNNRAVALDDGGPEGIGLVFPAGLRAEVERAARKARRSLNAEITKFLEEGRNDV